VRQTDLLRQVPERVPAQGLVPSVPLELARQTDLPQQAQGPERVPVPQASREAHRTGLLQPELAQVLGLASQAEHRTDLLPQVVPSASELAEQASSLARRTDLLPLALAPAWLAVALALGPVPLAVVRALAQVPEPELALAPVGEQAPPVAPSRVAVPAQVLVPVLALARVPAQEQAVVVH
jgi:hypothetical protein